MYNKLFTKILDSSVWVESYPTRIVWVTLMAAMDEDGFCQFATLTNLARRAAVTLEEAEIAIGRLEMEDLGSSDPDNEGRRIERVPGGWMVLNGPKYKDIVSREESKRLNRERVKRHREKKKGEIPSGNADSLQCDIKTLPKAQSNEPVMQSDTETYTDIETNTSTSTARAPHKAAAVASKRITQAVNPEADEDLSELAERVAVAHPRSQLKHLGPMEIPQKDLQAVVSAILLESAKQSLKVAEVGELLLNSVHELAATVPRSEWHFLKPLTAYFGEFEYRRDPTTFKRSTKEGNSNGRRSGRTDGNAEAIQRLLGTGEDSGAGSGSIVADLGGCAGPGHKQGEDSGGVCGGDERIETERVHPGVLQGAERVQILPTPSYPPRIQWPGSRR